MRPCVYILTATVLACAGLQAKGQVPTSKPSDWKVDESAGIGAKSVPGPRDDGSRDIEGRKLSPKGSWTDLRGMMRTLLALALVIALIFGARLLIRRYGHSAGASAREAAVEVVARTAVGPKKDLLMVRFGRRVLLIGSSANGFDRLGEVDQQQEVDELLSAGRQRQGPKELGQQSNGKAGV